MVGRGQRVFVIAEAGVNHNGDPELARRLARTAADAGADAVKFQTFDADRVASEDSPKAAYQLETTNPNESQRQMLRSLQLPEDEYEPLARFCGELGIVFLSTPFDELSVDLLEPLVPAFKLGSGEVTNLPLLRHVAGKGKPVILSTGMSDLAEVREAVAALRRAGDPPLVLLHCVSSYPAPASAANLRAIQTMAEDTGVPIGYSDHTEGLEASLAAVALGACVIEKHFTLDRAMEGPDHPASLEPADLARLIAGIREVEAALGNGEKQPQDVELPNRDVVRRSLTAARPIAAGEEITAGHLISLRPAGGISPMDFDRVIGRVAAREIPAGERITEADLR
jgi:N-acetylneuraminate synthase/N,N'-diacetyllegionaminate synthase